MSVARIDVSAGEEVEGDGDEVVDAAANTPQLPPPKPAATAARSPPPPCLCVCAPLADEFSWSNLSCALPLELTYLFTTSQWHFNPLYYVLYKVCCSIYLFSWLVISGVSGHAGGKWFIYLTDLSYLLLTLYHLYSTVLCVNWYAVTLDMGLQHQPRDDRKQSAAGEQQQQDEGFQSAAGTRSYEAPVAPCGATLRTRYRIQWSLYTASHVAALSVTFAYWSFLYPFTEGEEVSGVNFNTHAMNSLVVVLEVMLCRVPVRLAHLPLPAAYISAYFTFTLVYWALGGRDTRSRPWIYPILDYGSRPGLAAGVIAFALLVGVPAMQLLLVVAYRLRLRLYRWVEKREEVRVNNVSGGGLSGERGSAYNNYDSFV